MTFSKLICFDLKAGEEDGSHFLFEMTPNACASLLSEQARQESRKKDAANDKVAAVVDDVLSKSNETGKRSQPPRQCNLPRADASMPSKAIINVEDDDIDDSDNDMDSAISAQHGGRDSVSNSAKKTTAPTPGTNRGRGSSPPAAVATTPAEIKISPNCTLKSC